MTDIIRFYIFTILISKLCSKHTFRNVLGKNVKTTKSGMGSGVRSFES